MARPVARRVPSARPVPAHGGRSVSSCRRTDGRTGLANLTHRRGRGRCGDAAPWREGAERRARQRLGSKEQLRKAPGSRGKARRAGPTQAPQQRGCRRASPEDPVERGCLRREKAAPGRRPRARANPKGRDPRPGAGRCGRGGEQHGQTQALGSVTHRGRITSLLETHAVPHQTVTSAGTAIVWAGPEDASTRGFAVVTC